MCIRNGHNMAVHVNDVYSRIGVLTCEICHISLLTLMALTESRIICHYVPVRVPHSIVSAISKTRECQTHSSVTTDISQEFPLSTLLWSRVRVRVRVRSRSRSRKPLVAFTLSPGQFTIGPRFVLLLLLYDATSKLRTSLRSLHHITPT